MLLYTLSSKFADVAELVDALVLGTSANGVGVRVPSSAPMTYLFELSRTDDMKINQKWLIFFVAKKVIQSLKERMVLEMKIIKEELRFEENLKKRLEFICEFSKVTPTFINGSIRKIDKTNISYIEPHRVIIKNTTFLVFNYSNDVYISNLVNKIRLSELEEYLKKI